MPLSRMSPFPAQLTSAPPIRQVQSTWFNQKGDGQVPTVALICADNQRLAVPWGDRAGAMIGIDAMGQTERQAGTIRDAVQALIASRTLRDRLRECSLALVDGFGAERVAQRIRGLHPTR